ncbi:PadR family transcriptional regulator [Amycolatopsis sp. NPDC051716]|uniref:PadR family transcriptional regulator n=1 Tax=Amycolatopsis sp. NPDC051716 TaxID=3155804 RepID=UPI00341D309E
MADAPARVTASLLDVLVVLLDGFAQGEDVHGWAIMKTIKRSGPTVYGVLDRLEDIGWVTGRWEDSPPESNKPRRRFYRLTPHGESAARALVAERRGENCQSQVHPTLGLALVRELFGRQPGRAT